MIDHLRSISDVVVNLLVIFCALCLIAYIILPWFIPDEEPAEEAGASPTASRAGK